jgi:translation initiation factor IF-3
MAHPELGQRILDGVIRVAGPIAKVENQARMEGRNMSLVLAPDKKAQEALKKAALEEAKKAEDEGTAPTESPVDAESTDAAESDADIDIETHLGLEVTAAEETAPPETPGDE